MYWIYFTLFILAVITPEVIRGQLGVLPEEEAEAAMVFLFGAAGFIIYFVKDRALLRHVRDKLLLQREKQDMTRDLSDSYSYIGEVNRKMDLMKDLVLALPEAANLFQEGKKKSPYDDLSRSVLLSSKAETFSLRIVHVPERRLVKEIHQAKNGKCVLVPVGKLVDSDRLFWEGDGCVFARSPRMIGPYAAYLIFPKTVNRHEDEEIFQTLATEALLLFFFERAVRQEDSPKSETKPHEDRH